MTIHNSTFKMIPQHTINNIKDRANDDIVDIIGRYVELKRSGNSYKGLCPYHDENTPSFSVSEAKGMFKCFGCGAGGDAVQFTMDHEGLTFIEAIRWLADHLHITITEEQSDHNRQRSPEQPPLTGAGLQGMKSRIRKSGYVILFLDEPGKDAFQDKDTEPWLLLNDRLTDKSVAVLNKYCDLIFLKSTKGYKNDTVFEYLRLLMSYNFKAYILSSDTAPGIKRTFKHGQVDTVDSEENWIDYLINHYGPDHYLKSNIQRVIASIEDNLARTIYTNYFIEHWNDKLNRLST